ncbi:MAG: DUF3253 domain-containing protein [Rhodospirillaceae bacterium]|nr:DUF3253 domain-containing protein [Rhodospirillaceae bacterium]
MSEDSNKTPETKPETKDDPIAMVILQTLAGSKTLTFKDIAMTLAEKKRRPKDGPELWRRYINAVKQQAVHLARKGRVEIIRKGEVADPDNFKGIVRVRLAKK